MVIFTVVVNLVAGERVYRIQLSPLPPQRAYMAIKLNTSFEDL
jgi:hypothetical protein